MQLLVAYFATPFILLIKNIEFLSEINWRRGQQLHEIEKNMMVYFLNFTLKEIAFTLNRNIKCIKKLIERYQRTGIINEMPNTVRPKSATPDEEFAILFAAIEDHFRK